METLKCDKKNMRIWVKALRSGKFKQGRGALHTIETTDEQTFCCLGVACEVAIANGLKLETGRANFDSRFVSYDDSINYLPKPVQAFLQLDNYDPIISEDISAIEANDSYNWSFGKIADELERTYGLTSVPWYKRMFKWK